MPKDIKMERKITIIINSTKKFKTIKSINLKCYKS